MRPIRFFSASLAVCLSLTLFSHNFHAAAQSPGTVDTAAAMPDVQVLLNKGLEFERGRLWAEAVQHYEKALRKHRDHATLNQRRLVSRLHYDVQRRYRDESFLAAVREMTPSQALDLYSEVLANLDAHYVVQPQWSRVAMHGTASLEVALTEAGFVNRTLAGVDPQKIESFRQNVHLHVRDRQNTNRYELRTTASLISQMAERELGIGRSAVILEYVCGAVSTLDTYTRFLTGDQMRETFDNLEGNFVGLGVELKPAKDRLQIISVVPNGPAAQSGLLPGESIVRVETSSTMEEDPTIAADLLRGPEGSFASITVMTVDGEKRELMVPRRRVEVPSVEGIQMVDADHGTGYMRISSFQKTTAGEVQNAIHHLRRQGMKTLVMDLRGNPGGLLTSAVEIADRFLLGGAIVTTKGRSAAENFPYTAHYAGSWPTDLRLMLLINNDSASASEILAGAIRDNHRGTIIGDQSYGKGSVQGIFRMQSANVGLCMTTAKFYSPSGKAISDNGVMPHVAARNNPAFFGRPCHDVLCILD
ncbi:MAG: S41 family peptidase, partial [Planctomycetota bacterium]